MTALPTNVMNSRRLIASSEAQDRAPKKLRLAHWKGPGGKLSMSALGQKATCAHVRFTLESGFSGTTGLWLIASPFIFGYAEAGALRYWHFVLGAAVVLLAMLELRQDWKLNAAELRQHSAR
jgi:hypothetical protein